jgi:hypothetical protein
MHESLAEAPDIEGADDIARDPSIVADRVELTLQFRWGGADRYLDGANPPRPRRR